MGSFKAVANRSHHPVLTVARLVLVVSLVATGLFVAQAPASATGNLTSLVSVSTTGGVSNGDSTGVDGVSVSADGRYIAFESTANNLVARDTNNTTDVFVRDVINGTTTLASVDRWGGPANNSSTSPRLSGDGRYLAFASAASDLVVGDTNGQPDVFVRDLVLGTTVRASVSNTAVEANNWSNHPSINGDGRIVVFQSMASNFGATDTNDSQDVYARDLVAGTTTKISNGIGGAQPTGTSTSPDVSADGRYVAYSSDAANLVPSDLNGVQDIFRFDIQTATTVRVSVSTANADPDNSSSYPAISGNGSVVAYRSYATNLVAGDTNEFADIFTRDYNNNSTNLISVGLAGASANENSTWPAISVDGRSVVFASSASNLVAGDGTTGPIGRDIFLRDRVANATERESVSTTGSDPDERSSNSGVSGDGRVVAFGSNASNLVAGDTATNLDVFVSDRGPGTPTFSVGDVTVAETDTGQTKASFTVRLSAPLTTPASVPFATAVPPAILGRDGTRPAVAGQDYVATSGTLFFPAGLLSATVDVLVNGDTTVEPDAQFVLQLGTPTGAGLGDAYGRGTIRSDDLRSGLVSKPWAVGSAFAQGASTQSVVSADGRSVAFVSSANDLAEGDGGRTDVFVGDLSSGTVERVSVNQDGTDASGDSSAPAISADGRYVAFVSTGTNLVTGDTNGVADVFVRDRLTRTNRLISVSTGNGPTNGASSTPSISADGQVVAFVSTATNIVASDPNAATADVYVRDLAAATTARLGGTTTATTVAPSVAGAGRYVAVQSTAELIASDTDTLTDIYRYDRQAATFSRVSVGAGATVPNGSSTAPSISADGDRVAFVSDASNLVTGDTNAVADVFVRTMTAATTTLLSVSTAAGPANGASSAPAISADGQAVGFLSSANNLIAPDANSLVDAFVARTGSAIARVSVDSTGSDPNGASTSVGLDRDGRMAAWASTATDIVTGDSNGASDVFSRDLGTPGRVEIGDATVWEGTSGTSTLVFTITRTGPTTGALAIPWHTVDGTAVAPGDYTSASGTATIPAGATSVQVEITVKGDTTTEPDETLSVVLVPPAGISPLDVVGLGVIRGDDRPVTVPGAPTIGTATAGNASATLTWTAPVSDGASAITGYIVTPYIGATAQTPKVFNSTATTQNITGLTNGTTYTFKVAAKNAVGTSTDSAASNAVTPASSTVPGAPVIGTALPSNGLITVKWTAPSNGGSAITGYLVTPYIGAVAQPTVVFNSTATTQNLNGLTNGTAYTFTVQAKNAIGTGAASAPSNAVTAGTPGAPGFQAAVPGDGTARVAFTTPPNNGSSITGYQVTPYIGAVAQPTQVFNNTATSQIVTGLTNGTTYTFSVQAINGNGAGASAVTAPIVVGTPNSPGFPNPVPENASGVRISWLAAANNGSPVTKYTVTPYLGSTAQTPIVFNNTGTLQHIVGLTTGATYTFRVYATNARGDGTYSTSAAVTIGSPAPPGFQTAAPGDGSAKVQYAIPPNNGSAITGYIVTPVIGSTPQPAQTFNTPSATQLNVTGLTNGQTYSFRIQAVNAIGASPNAVTQTVIVGSPATPAFPSAQPGNGNAKVSFLASADNGSPLTNYTVTPYLGSTALPTQTFPTTSTSVTVTGLTNGQTYTFRVAATNARGASPVGTTPTSIKVGTPTTPGFPSGQSGNASAKISWLGSTPNVGSITGYAITPVLGTTVLPTQTFASTATTQTITGLTNGQTYTFRIAALNSVGTGPYSTTAAVKIGQPAAPTNIIATAGAGQATVSWTAGSDNGSPITGYVVTPFKNGVAQPSVTYNSTATTQTLAGLTPGATYTFKVVAKNANGTGILSAASNAIVPT